MTGQLIVTWESYHKMNSGIMKRQKVIKQFKKCIDDDNIMTEIIRELTTIEKTNEITSEQILAWTRRVEAQRAQKVLIAVIKENKEFDATKRHDQQSSTIDNAK